MNLFDIFKMDYVLLLGIDNSISKFVKNLKKKKKNFD